MILDPHELRAEALDQAVKRLTDVGARVVFPADVITAQSTWPEGCPVSESDLKQELRSIRDSVCRLEATAKGLLDGLPDPAEYDYKNIDDVPPSVYCHLHGTLAFLTDQGLKELGDDIEAALAATPESLREAWLASTLPREGAFRLLVPSAGESDV